ncbi:zinc finger, CCHC-type containing protein [Tanacetum coccineum]
MVLDNDGVASKTTKEKVKSLAIKAKFTMEQTSDSQDGSDEDIDEEEEAKAFNLLARNFRKFFRKGGESSNPKGACYNYGIEGHFASECRKPKENKAFMGGAWSDSEDGDEKPNVATCLMAIDSQGVVSKPSSSNNELIIIDLKKENEKLLNKINDLEIEVKKLANDKEVVEPCKTCDVLTKEVDSLKYSVSKPQDEALNFSKFKSSSIALDDMLSRQKLQHGRMILESVENGPLIWPSIEENGVTRPKKYSELSATEAIQADCDIKATNIILQVLPPEVYSLVSIHKVAKELWARIQLLMLGTSLTKQERECKLYDEFDKFAYKKGGTLHEFYLRFSLLLNDMDIYNMKLEQF